MKPLISFEENCGYSTPLNGVVGFSIIKFCCCSTATIEAVDEQIQVDFPQQLLQDFLLVAAFFLLQQLLVVIDLLQQLLLTALTLVQLVCFTGITKKYMSQKENNMYMIFFKTHYKIIRRFKLN